MATEETSDFPSRSRSNSDKPPVRIQSQEIDTLLTLLGPWGFYQILQLCLAHSVEWPAVTELFSVMYTGYQPPVRCAGLNSTSGNFGDEDIGNLSDYKIFQKTCRDVIDIVNGSRVTGSCSHGYEYNQPKEASFASEWDLMCDKSYLAQLPSSLFIVGQMVGASFFTFLADRYGRQRVCIFSQVATLISSLATAWSPNIVVLITIRFFAGTFQQGLMMCLSVISVEILRTRNRSVFFVLIGLTWPLFEQVLIGFGFAFRFINWRYLQLLFCGTGLITLILNCVFLEESFRWLFARNRRKTVEKQLAKAIRYNDASEEKVLKQAEKCFSRRSYFEEVKITDGVAVSSETKENEIGKTSVLDLITHPQLRNITLIMTYIWIVNASTYFGLVLSSPKLAGNRFWNHCLLSLDTVPATLISYFIITRYGRKVGVVLANCLAGVCLIVAVLIQTFADTSLSNLVLAFTVLGKLGNSASFFILFQYAPELYPTNLRSFGLGFASSASRLGAAVAPFTNLLIEIYPWAPGAIFGVLSLISCLLVIILPETLHNQLPQSLAEMISWKKKSMEESQ